MANDFRFGVVALDRFTAIFKRLRVQAVGVSKPLANVERVSAKVFAFPQVKAAGKGLGVVAAHTREIASNLSSISSPAASLFGMAAPTSLVGAAAAVAALTGRWAQMGFAVNRAAQGIGVSVDMLQRYRGAASLAGVSTDAMTSAVGTLARTLQDAQFGRNPQALVMLSKLGITIRRGKDGIVDTEAALVDLSRVLSRIKDPQVQRVLASAFGLEEALPLLRQGPEAIRKLTDQAARMGMVMGRDAIAGADRFTTSLNKLKAAIEGVFNASGSKLGGSMSSGMDYLSESVTQRRLSANPLDWLTWAMELGGALSDPPVRNWSRSASGKVTSDGSAPRSKARSTWGGEEQARRDAEGLAIVRRELENATDPRDREALQREISRRTGEPLKIELQITGAPPGTQAQARIGQQTVPVRVSNAMPNGSLP